MIQNEAAKVIGREPVKVEHAENGVAVVRLNLPDLRNPISDPDVIDALADAMQSLDGDEAVRAVILTGEGKAFSAGGNLHAMRTGAGLADAVALRTRTNYRNGIQRLPLVFEKIEVPVVAAVNGPAVGAGCDLTCMCDIRIAATSAWFAASFVKVGLVPGDGGAWLLPRIVGFSKACEMVLTGEPLLAEAALTAGLVSQVVVDDALPEAALAMATKIALLPRHATRLTKRLMRESCNHSLAGTLELSAAFQALAHATQDQQEAVAAMLEKRPPRFVGN